MCEAGKLTQVAVASLGIVRVRSLRKVPVNAVLQNKWPGVMAAWLAGSVAGWVDGGGVASRKRWIASGSQRSPWPCL